MLAISAQILLSCGLLGKCAVMSSYQLSAFGLGQIKVHLYHGLAPYAISGHNMGLLRAETLVNTLALCSSFWAHHGPPEDCILGATWHPLRTETRVKEPTLPGSQFPTHFRNDYLNRFIVNAYVMLYDRNRNCEHCCMSGETHEHHMATNLKVF